MPAMVRQEHDSSSTAPISPIPHRLLLIRMTTTCPFTRGSCSF